MSDVYDKLYEFMNVISPLGMPKTPNGAEMKLLKDFYDQEEAEHMLRLSPQPQPLEVIAGAMGKPPEETKEVLERMFQKGLCMRLPTEDSHVYIALPFAPGAFEMQVGRTDAELARLAPMMEDYCKNGFWEALVEHKTPMQRTLVIEETIPTDFQVAPYERASEYIKNAARPIAVADCLCRKMNKAQGTGCDHPIEDTCMIFGPFAMHYIETNNGREVDEKEALEILKKTEEAGLVHTPLNYKAPGDSTFV